MESLNILHSRGEIISEYVGCIDRVLDKMIIKVTCMRAKYKSKIILRSVKDWDQLNFTVFTMTCEHSYSKMKSN